MYSITVSVEVRKQGTYGSDRYAHSETSTTVPEGTLSANVNSVTGSVLADALRQIEYREVEAEAQATA